MKTRLNKTGNTKGEVIYIIKTLDYEGRQVETSGTYISIDDKGYVCYSTTGGELRYTLYKNCYKEKEQKII